MSNKCKDLHYYFNELKRLHFPYKEEQLPDNGIYILFEKGESAHNVDRVVRVGTHTGVGKLRSRLNEHFLVENKNRSIFRKNIGRAILNKQEDPYLKLWELDTTTRKNKERYQKLLDMEYQKEIEKEITRIIQNNFSFVVLELTDKQVRLNLEAKIISEISNCKICNSSKSWLGNYSPKEKIRESGLWQVNNLYKQGLSTGDLNILESC
ncbi:hypothetical protein [Pseudalkalibacillus sp. SCS-8]|uniref:hypothetical protein n=1 Tax=Pseudalkalibacillus nanhaiensis TaxID=3115291 RepID=UPI0032DBBE7E